MSIKMTSVTFRADSSRGQVQKRVPVDVLERARGRRYPICLPAFGRTPEQFTDIRIVPVIKISLRVSDRDAARFRNASVQAQLEALFASIRSGPVELSQMQTVALSGEIYRLVVERCQDNPGNPERWEAFKAFTAAAREGLIANPPEMPNLGSRAWDEQGQAYDIFGYPNGPELLEALNSLQPGANSLSLESRFGVITSWVLAHHKIEANATSRLMLLQQVADAVLDAGWAMKRAATGDYTPDPKAARFPPFVSQPKREQLTLSTLFEHWKAEARPAGSTVTTWKAAVGALRSHLDHDLASQVRRVDVQQWKDKLIKEGYKTGTINGTHLASIQALLSHAVRNSLLTENVAAGIKVREAKRAGAGMLPYEDDEVAELLRLAANEKDPSRRWLPLLAACSGARVGELAQLWSDRVREKDGVLVMELRPAKDGGSLKNHGSERDVPLHAALIEAGFVAFAQSRDGPLFYRRASGTGARHASKGTVNRLSDWVRLQPGFNDKRKAPMHAFRHWWKTAASKVGVPDSQADLIQGHADQSASARYRHVDLPTLKRAVDRIPIPRNSTWIRRDQN